MMLISLAACLGALLSIWVFYPGYMSFDSAYQWWQVRHGVMDPAHPPVMTLIWSVTEYMLSGPGGYFVLQQLFYWIAIGAFIMSLRLPTPMKVALVLMLGFWPPLWGLSLHLWKDVGMFSLFCLACACYSHDLVRPSAVLRALALLFILVACFYRHNAITAAYPLLVYAVSRHLWQKHGESAGTWRPLIYGGLGCIVMYGLVALPQQVLKPASISLFEVVAMWDVAAVSIQEDELLFPPRWLVHETTLDDIREDFNPVFGGFILSGGNVITHYNPESGESDFRDLRTVWSKLPFHYPGAYWRHRFNVMMTTLGWRHDPGNGNLVFHLGMTTYRDNPPVTQRPSEAKIQVQKWLTAFDHSPLFQNGWYALICLLVLVVAATKRLMLPAAIAASGLMYALPLLVLAPSADFRYMSWTIMAALLALLRSIRV